MPTEPRADADRWEVQLRKGSLDLAVLACLWHGRLYGLEIIDRLQRSVDLPMPEGTIYPLLARLEADCLVAAEWAPGSGARPRKYYALTETGRQRVTEMAQIWSRHVAAFNILLEPIARDEPK